MVQEAGLGLSLGLIKTGVTFAVMPVFICLNGIGDIAYIMRV